MTHTYMSACRIEYYVIDHLMFGFVVTVLLFMFVSLFVWFCLFVLLKFINLSFDYIVHSIIMLLTAKLISAFVFTTRTVQFIFLHLKFPVSSQLLCLYSSVCVAPVRKPHCWFSHDAAHLFQDNELSFTIILMIRQILPIRFTKHA